MKNRKTLRLCSLIFVLALLLCSCGRRHRLTGNYSKRSNTSRTSSSAIPAANRGLADYSTTGMTIDEALEYAGDEASLYFVHRGDKFYPLPMTTAIAEKALFFDDDQQFTNITLSPGDELVLVAPNAAPEVYSYPFQFAPSSSCGYTLPFALVKTGSSNAYSSIGYLTDSYFDLSDDALLLNGLSITDYGQSHDLIFYDSDSDGYGTTYSCLVDLTDYADVDYSSGKPVLKNPNENNTVSIQFGTDSDLSTCEATIRYYLFDSSKATDHYMSQPKNGYSVIETESLPAGDYIFGIEIYASAISIRH